MENISHPVYLHHIWQGFHVWWLQGWSFSTCFDVIPWEIWPSPKLHLSAVVSVGRVCGPKKCVISAIQTNWIGSGNRKDFNCLNFELNIHGAVIWRHIGDAARWDLFWKIPHLFENRSCRCWDFFFFLKKALWVLVFLKVGKLITLI